MNMLSIVYHLISLYLLLAHSRHSTCQLSHCPLPSAESGQSCESDDNELHSDNEFNRYKSRKYLAYDINFGEGFNLRRDVYMRMASLVKSLGPDWTLILPRWSSLPHWRLNHRHPLETREAHKWSTYFDTNSLNKYMNAIEFDDYIAYQTDNNNNAVIDVIIALENFMDSFEENGIDWREHFHINNECPRSRYFARIDGHIEHIFDNENIEYKRLVCVQIEGFVSTLNDIIRHNFSDMNSILISNAEVILHSDYGDVEYWKIRRSMRFNDKLISIGNQFRQQFLNSNDVLDKTVVTGDWRSMRRSHGDAVGGPYLAVHWRRADFAKSRPKDVANIDCTVKQIYFALTQYLTSKRVFISTDADIDEWHELERLLTDKKVEVFRFSSESLSDGQTAIVDQWIASHASVFIGTYDSTFSFRIQEEREIFGFMPNTTFNALCAKCNHRLMLKLCKQESQWKIVYD